MALDGKRQRMPVKLDIVCNFDSRSGGDEERTGRGHEGWKGKDMDFGVHG